MDHCQGGERRCSLGFHSGDRREEKRTFLKGEKVDVGGGELRKCSYIICKEHGV